MKTLLLVAALFLPQETKPAPPTELYDVTRVIDGDTIWIQREGKEEKLRLLSVDTEEKITGRPNTSTTKPETVFGEETAVWARDFFADLAEEDGPARVGLRFPAEEETRDIYGRLLCHVILADGRDFNLLLVELGKSPYFNKYGNSRICHEDFVRAQKEARKAQLGLWHPETNQPRTEGAPAAKRPYDLLLPWWQARADAIDAFRAAQEADETGCGVVDAESPTQLFLAQQHCAESEENQVVVFGSIDRFFDERDGSLTVLFRTSERDDAFRASLPANRSKELESLLRTSTEEMRQNYLFVRGHLVRGSRGFRMDASSPEAWRLAGPEPQSPER